MIVTIDTRTGFSAELKVSDVAVQMADIWNLCEAEVGNFRRVFNRYGFALVQHPPVAAPEHQLRGLTQYLGSPNFHNRANENGIVVMAPDPRFPEYLGASNCEHPLHTDGAYDADPPRFLCLQCVESAGSGGESVLVSSKAIFDWLATNDPEGLAALFEEDALTVERADQKGTKAIFAERQGSLQMVWRADHTASFSTKPAVARAVDEVKAFISDPQNRLVFKLEPNQVVVADNYAVLHGRKAFNEGDRRVLNRMNMVGDCNFARELVNGFAGSIPARHAEASRESQGPSPAHLSAHAGNAG